MNIGYKINKPISNYQEYTKTAKWCNINNAVIEDKGEYYEVVEIPVIEKSLDELKQEKLQELKKLFQTARETTHCDCELGFEIDANETAYINVLGLVDRISDDETKMFRAYDNTFHEVTKNDIKIIKTTIETNAEMLYQNKWIKENKINQASSIEELNEISLEF